MASRTGRGPSKKKHVNYRIFYRAGAGSRSRIAFLSGGQSDSEAEQHLNIMNKKNDLPWRVTFSYARAIQAAALAAWKGDDANLRNAQKILIERASRCSKASIGEL